MKPDTLRHRSTSRTFAPVPHSRLVALFLARNAATLERASALSRALASDPRRAKYRGDCAYRTRYATVCEHFARATA